VCVFMCVYVWHTGKALLLSQWDRAIALVMSSKYVSHPDELAAKKGFSERSLSMCLCLCVCVC